MRSSTDANDAHRSSQHQSNGPPAMPPRQAPSSREALESAVGAGMALPPLSVLLSVSLQGQSVLARRALRPHSSRGPCACPGRQVDAEREAVAALSAARPNSHTSPPRASRYRPSSSSERWSSGPPLHGAARRPTELTAEVACHSRSLPTRQRCRTRNSRPYAEEAMSENSPQGSFLRTLPYGSRDPAHLPSPRSPREERAWTRCHWTLHLKRMFRVTPHARR